MAFKRWQKSPSRKTPERNWSDEEMKIIGWCLSNNIAISIMPDWKEGLNRWIIYINVNGKIHVDPNKYKEDVVYNKVNEYYKYYYDKYNK